MPSSKNYVRNLKQEMRTERKRRKVQGDPTPKGTRARSARNKLRKKLGLKVGDPRQAGHTSGKKLNVKVRGSTGGKGRVQNARSNSSSGGRVGSRSGKSSGAYKGHKARRLK